MTFAEIVAAFDGRVNGSPDRATARCPGPGHAHGDRAPSLSLSREGSRVLVHCFTGCETADVLAARGLSMRDLFDDRSGAAPVAPSAGDRPAIDPQVVLAFRERLSGDPAALRFLRERRGLSDATIAAYQLGHDGERYAIPVRDESGRFVNIRRYRPGGEPKFLPWRPGYGEARLYPLPEWLEATAEGADYIVEGELDALLARQLGLNAVTSTGGAGTFKPEWADHFRARDVVICYDCDRPGRDGAAHVRDVLANVARSVVVVDLGLGDDGADFTDYVVDGGHSVDDFLALVDAARRATPAPTVDTPSGDDDANAPPFYTLAELLNDPAITAPPRAVAAPLAWGGRITLFAAGPKAGKSTLVGHALAVASREGQRCGVVSLDESLGDTVARLARFGADPARVFLTNRKPDDLAAWVRATAVSVLAIDSLSRYVTDAESGDARAWTAALAPVQTVARDLRCGVVLVHHTRRSDDSYRDSGAIGAAVDVIIELRKRGDDRVATIQGRFPVPDFSARLDTEGRVVVTVAETGTTSNAPTTGGPAPLDLQLAVLRLLQSAEPEGLKANTWQRLAEEPGISRAAFFRARRALYERGAISYASRLYRVSPTGARLLTREGEP